MLIARCWNLIDLSSFFKEPLLSRCVIQLELFQYFFFRCFLRNTFLKVYFCFVSWVHWVLKCGGIEPHKQMSELRIQWARDSSSVLMFLKVSVGTQESCVNAFMVSFFYHFFPLKITQEKVAEVVFSSVTLIKLKLFPYSLSNPRENLTL